MRFLKTFFYVITAAAAIVLIALLFFIITEFRPDEITSIPPSYNSSAADARPGGLRLLSWNIGYCGLDDEMDFFLEGGTQMRAPLERQRNSLDAVIKTMSFQEPDVLFIQEIDTAAKRSFGIDQLYTVISILNGYEAYHALNFKSPFVPVPVKSPIGRVESGIAVLSRFSAINSERLQLPGSYSWPVKIFHLKRCALLTRIPSAVEGKDWCLLNVHLTAYGDGGQRKQQLEYIKNLIAELYAEGHFVVAGGDWNSLLPGAPKEHFGDYTTDEEYLFWVQSIPAGWTPDNWQWCYDSEVPTARSLEQAYKKGENFRCIIDGFLVSPNLRVDEVSGFDLDFEYTDHNPVAVTVSIR